MRNGIIETAEDMQKIKQIYQLQNLLEVSEKEHYKTLQQLAIATKALREYADPQIWEMDGFCYKDRCIAEQALKEIDLVGTSVSLVNNKMQANTLVNNKM